jgi:hypothetical protein
MTLSKETINKMTSNTMAFMQNILFIIMPIVIFLDFIMLNVITQSVTLLNVAAPK